MTALQTSTYPSSFTINDVTLRKTAIQSEVTLLNLWMMPGIDAAPDLIGRRRISWAVVVMILVAITSSSLSALSLYHVLALQAEVEGLRSEVTRRRDECRDMPEENVEGPQQEQREDHRSKSQVGNVVLNVYTNTVPIPYVIVKDKKF